MQRRRIGDRGSGLSRRDFLKLGGAGLAGAALLGKAGWGGGGGSGLRRRGFLKRGGAGLAGAALLGTAGCGGGGSASNDLLMSWGSDDTGTLPKLIEKFNKQS